MKVVWDGIAGRTSEICVSIRIARILAVRLIGVVGLTKSFTLGAYIRLEADTAAYALTVAHGLPDPPTPVTPETIPKIQIQQPSSADVK